MGTVTYNQTNDSVVLPYLQDIIFRQWTEGAATMF